MNSVVRHGVFFSRMQSGVGRNVQLCCEKYGRYMSDLLFIFHFYFILVSFGINGGKVPVAKVTWSESLQELSFPGAKGPAISLLGAKVPGNDRARERIGQGPIGRFAPGSELARE